MEIGQDITRRREALAKLPLKKREVLILSRYQELKYKEIAELLGCQIGTVEVMFTGLSKTWKNLF